MIEKAVEKIFENGDYSTKGVTTRLFDNFLFSYNNKKYIIYLEARGVQVNNRKFLYAIYSIEDNVSFNRTSEVYKSIVEILPKISNIKNINNSLEFQKMMDLEAKRDNLISDCILKNKFNNFDIKPEYINCLEEIKKFKTNEMKEIYDFFINKIKEDKNGAI